MTIGDTVKRMAQILIAFRYPTNLEKGLANTTEIIAGISPNNSS